MMNAVTQKDVLFALVNEDGTVEERCQRWHRVLSALELTVGLWSELGYAYKGVDLTRLIEDTANRLQIEESHKDRHHATAKKIEQLLDEVKQEAWKIQVIFYAEQQARMSTDI